MFKLVNSKHHGGKKMLCILLKHPHIDLSQWRISPGVKVRFLKFLSRSLKTHIVATVIISDIQWKF